MDKSVKVVCLKDLDLLKLRSFGTFFIISPVLLNAGPSAGKVMPSVSPQPVPPRGGGWHWDPSNRERGGIRTFCPFVMRIGSVSVTGTEFEWKKRHAITPVNLTQDLRTYSPLTHCDIIRSHRNGESSRLQAEMWMPRPDLCASVKKNRKTSWVQPTHAHDIHRLQSPFRQRE